MKKKLSPNTSRSRVEPSRHFILVHILTPIGLHFTKEELIQEKLTEMEAKVCLKRLLACLRGPVGQQRVAAVV